MQINNSRSNTSFGINIPLNVRSEIIKSIPQGHPPKTTTEVINHIQKLQDFESDAYTLGFRRNPITEQNDFVLKTIFGSSLKIAPIATINKRLLTSKFLSISEEKIQNAIEYLNKKIT